ncbi:MAG TPA: hypothetical protein VKA59_25760 [Vicinamibacterales bacterium]|nr:hypothetical protein [Vicinamibacterales bacterium]
MTKRALIAVGIATVIAIASLGTVPLVGQGASAPPLVVTAYNGTAPEKPYTAPKTPWGDPDLQGVWSSDDTQGIPMQRPQNISSLYQSEEQWAARQKQTQQGVQNALNAIGTFRGDYARRAFRQTSLIVDPADGRQPAITPAAEKRRASRDRGTFGDGPFNTPEDFTLYDRCITRGIVGSVLRVVYGNGNRIVQAPGVVAISYEMIHDTRVLYTDGRPHVNQAIRQYLGDSRARWVGDELVVDTTNLTDKTSIGLNGNGLRHSDQMKITERFKRVAEDVVQYQITIDDPVTYAAPWTISLPLTPLEGNVLLPYECHEGNLALMQSLSAERAEDRALEEDLKKGIKRARRPVQDGNPQAGGGGRGRGAGAGGAGAPAGGRGNAPAEGDQER